MRDLMLAAIALGLHSVALAGPREIAAEAFPSVVMLVTEDSHSQPLAIGSGFFVKQNIIASNAHVVEGAAGGYAKLVGQNQKFRLKGMVASDPRHDLVLLAVETAKAPALKLGDFAKAAVGDRIFSVGNPKGLEGTFAEGIISGIREIGGDKLLQITAPISPGSSGGPILDESGSAVGVAVATYQGGQNLNFAIPISLVTNLMAKVGPTTGFAPRETQAAEKSYVSGLGEDSTHGVELANFEWTESRHPSAPYTEKPIEFIIRNRLRQPVTKIEGMLIFYDSQKQPLGYEYFHWPDEYAGATMILPGLAKPGQTTVAQKTYRDCSASGSIGSRMLAFEIVEGSY